MKYTVLLLTLLATMTTMTAANDWVLPEYVNIFGYEIPVLKETARHAQVKDNHVVADKFSVQRSRFVSPKMRARREAKGLSSPRLASGVNEEDLADLGAVSQFLLGIAYGSQYSESSVGSCYQTVEDSILIFDELGQAFAQFYNPVQWGEIGILLIDYTDLSSAIYADCDIQILFTTLSELFSIEGASSLGSRVLAGLIYELPNAIDLIKEGSAFNIGTGCGNIISLGLNYYI
jgi:hypothetical protein